MAGDVNRLVAQHFKNTYGKRLTGVSDRERFSIMQAVWFAILDMPSHKKITEKAVESVTQSGAMTSDEAYKFIAEALYEWESKYSKHDQIKP